MGDKRHKQLIDVVSTIGAVADMPHWITTRISAEIYRKGALEDMTVKELLTLLSETKKHVEIILS